MIAKSLRMRRPCRRLGATGWSGPSGYLSRHFGPPLG